MRDKALAEEDRKGQINISQGEIEAIFFFLKGIFLEAEQLRVGGPLMVAEIEDTIVILEEVAQGMMNFPLRDSKETFQAFVVARVEGATCDHDAKNPKGGKGSHHPSGLPVREIRQNAQTSIFKENRWEILITTLLTFIFFYYIFYEWLFSIEISKGFKYTFCFKSFIYFKNGKIKWLYVYKYRKIFEY